MYVVLEDVLPFFSLLQAKVHETPGPPQNGTSVTTQLPLSLGAFPSNLEVAPKQPLAPDSCSKYSSKKNRNALSNESHLSALHYAKARCKEHVVLVCVSLMAAG